VNVASVRLQIQDWIADELTRAAFSLVTADGTAAVRLQVAGEHQVSNALSAAAIGLAAGLDLTAVAAALSSAVAASRWRMQLTDLPDGITVINERIAEIDLILDADKLDSLTIHD